MQCTEPVFLNLLRGPGIDSQPGQKERVAIIFILLPCHLVSVCSPKSLNISQTTWKMSILSPNCDFYLLILVSFSLAIPLEVILTPASSPHLSSFLKLLVSSPSYLVSLIHPASPSFTVALIYPESPSYLLCHSSTQRPQALLWP
jgi:hypothetical protein